MAPNNLVMTMMGAGLLWVGWFGFNAGSTVQSGLDTARALTMIQVSAASNIAGWSFWDQLLVQLKGMGATIGLAALGTYVICLVVEKSVGFRIDEQFEFDGLDKSLHSENGYGLIFPESR